MARTGYLRELVNDSRPNGPAIINSRPANVRTYPLYIVMDADVVCEFVLLGC